MRLRESKGKEKRNMKHDSKIWNLPRRVEVFYKTGWQCKRTKFKSLAECEGYLKKEIGDDTYIHLPDREVEDAASAEVITTCASGNTTVCAMVSLGDAAMDYGKTVRALKENIKLFAKDFGKGM